MDAGLFTNQRKKLLMAGFFLWCVAMLIGGEEDPGVIAQVNEDKASAVVGRAPQGAAPAYQPPPQAARVESRPAQDTSLDAWYAEAAPNEAVTPDPVDESHLVNDAKPLTGAEPLVQ